ncbi:MAG: DUF1963 domain-containing protein [Patulibacter sp.]|nr:DUF1963 domain-containing protein [Patulibacter sp.]
MDLVPGFAADLRSEDDDLDLLEFMLEDEDDPERVLALQRHMDQLDGGHRVTPPPPEPEDVSALAQGLTVAILRGVAASGIDDPFVVDHRAAGGDDPHQPGFVRVGSASFRDAMRASVAADGAALERLFEGSPETGVVTFRVAEFCDPRTLAELRRLDDDQRLGGDRRDDAAALTEAVADGVLRRLNAPGAIPGAVENFLMLGGAGKTYGWEEGEARARRVLGPAPVETFRASLTSRVDADAAAPTVDARRDRAALARTLAARGLPDADALVRDHAEPALRLVEARAGEPPAAIVHGRGVLPPGEVWPHTTAGRALAFLAALDLTRLQPTIDGAPPLPRAGWMLFFADIDDPTGYDPARWNEPQPTPEEWAQGEFDGSPARNVPGSEVRMFWVPPGTEPVAADPPGLRGRLPVPELRFVAVEQLTLDDAYGAGEMFDLAPAHATAYDEIAGGLRARQEGDDWVLGAVTGVQGHPTDPGTVLLLHLASVEFQDGGAIQFRIPADALAAQDWTQVYGEASSG